MDSKHSVDKAQHLLERDNYPIGDNQTIGKDRVVLVVDDDADILPLISELLKSISFDPITAENAKEAIGILDGGVIPDLLLTDINMPGIDGFELAVKIKDVQPNIGVVYMSGCDSAICRSYDVEVQAQLLVKPFELSALTDALANASPLKI